MSADNKLIPLHNLLALHWAGRPRRICVDDSVVTLCKELRNSTSLQRHFAHLTKQARFKLNVGASELASKATWILLTPGDCSCCSCGKRDSFSIKIRYIIQLLTASNSWDRLPSACSRLRRGDFYTERSDEVGLHEIALCHPTGTT